MTQDSTRCNYRPFANNYARMDHCLSRNPATITNYNRRVGKRSLEIGYIVTCSADEGALAYRYL
jgi:hypothetical protein